jgi:hypothetical protein
MKNPSEELCSVLPPWPFVQWGVDIVGLLPTGKGGRKFLVVAVDYFTKWVEVEVLAIITAGNVKNNLWKSIMCRYGIPHAFVTDNGRQFDCESFQKWCVELCIRKYFSTLGHPQANVQVKVTNKTLMVTLKGSLGRFLARGAMLV